MPAGLKITLTKNEALTLQELELAKTIPRRTKCRASVLRLNSRGWTVKAIADYGKWAESTVRQTIHRWNKWGLAGLWDAKGRGKKPSWSKEDWQVIEQWLNEPCSQSSRQLSQRWAFIKTGLVRCRASSSNTKKSGATPLIFNQQPNAHQDKSGVGKD